MAGQLASPFTGPTQSTSVVVFSGIVEAVCILFNISEFNYVGSILAF